jgi:uncharacterized protein (TIGR00251 family)
VKINVKVHPNSSQEKIVEDKGEFGVWMKQKAVNGKANESLLKILKKHFKENIKIISGFTSRKKVVEVLE